jgi:thiosulfate/3-mercaptopyruvate sulfurtransferase
MPMTRARLPRPLVSTAWLHEHLGEADLVVLDASWYLPAAGRDPRAEFAQGHIPGARFWDLDLHSAPDTTLPHMLPSAEALERIIGGLGVGAATRVVVYDGSGANLSAPRVWWTLRVAGHEDVAVLDGGMAAWRAEGRPTETGPSTPVPSPFRVRFRPELVASREAVRARLADPHTQLVDARSSGRFHGTEPEPRPGLRGGHIPGARNLPFGAVTGADGRLLPADELRDRLREAGIDLERDIVVSCGSGVSACALGLGLEVLRHHRWAVYDGSWADWGREDGPPIAR